MRREGELRAGNASRSSEDSCSFASRGQHPLQRNYGERQPSWELRSAPVKTSKLSELFTFQRRDGRLWGGELVMFSFWFLSSQDSDSGISCRKLTCWGMWPRVKWQIIRSWIFPYHGRLSYFTSSWELKEEERKWGSVRGEGVVFCMTFNYDASSLIGGVCMIGLKGLGEWSP